MYRSLNSQVNASLHLFLLEHSVNKDYSIVRPPDGGKRPLSEIMRGF